MKRKPTFKFTSGTKFSQKLNGLLGVWVGISFSGLLIWNGIVGMPTQITRCNTPYPGMESIVKLAAGDTLCIPPGEIFRGKIESFPEGAQINVHNNATFHPVGDWEAKGTIVNQGYLILENTLDAKGLEIDNRGKVDFVDNLDESDALFVLNQLDASIKIPASIRKLDGRLEMLNYGDVYVEGDFTLGTFTNIENNGKIVLQGNVVINGQISNFGIVHSYESMYFGPDANIFNHCSLIAPNHEYKTHKGLINYGLMLKSSGRELEKELEKISCASRFKDDKPIILQYFSSQDIKGYTRLKWQIEKGSRASYFELERSYDKNNYYRLDHLEALDNQEHVYTMMDRSLDQDSSQNGVYYRLKMTNAQGKINYGPVLEIFPKQHPLVQDDGAYGQ